MRVLFVTAVLPSHYFVMAPFAWALRAAGHEVCVAAQPELVETVARSGLPVVPVGGEADFAARYRDRTAGRPAGAGARPGDPKALFCTVADGMADDLVAFARQWRPDAVVWEPTTLAGPLAAAACGAVSLRYLWGPDIVGRGIGRHNLPPQFAELFARFGIDVDDIPEWWNIDACPDDLQVTGNTQRVPVRYVPYSNSQHVPDWFLRRDGRKRVCVTLGITMTEVAGGKSFFAPRVLDALAELDIDLVTAVVPTQRPLLEGRVPDGVRVAEDGALHMLLPSCDLVIHHGGVGSMLTAALYGLPQLTITQMPDQSFYSGYLAGTGASVHLTGDEADPETLRSVVRRLLDDPSYRRAADGIRTAMLSRPTPQQIVPTVERLVAAARGAAPTRTSAPEQGAA
ncbi:nucleotide disphospho-sugar-binding domain-containing protein [Streptomyces sp. Caat 7-52]|uniref:nucleotide disphospho-sugar-binding domain-containing protein n=1 Tax=Streptomyces sp. Caat 7-52 TaxID=2949637 RepID=UPI002034AF54|nr:nucleotide disphospho-sugar-binding domain-containing protein [Streptomyces sp. Caat 7-52]